MKQRPTGVTVLSILQFIMGAFCLLGALAMFLGGGAAAAALAGRDSGLSGGMMAAIMGVGGIVFIVFAALWIATAIGMWQLKGWGRWLTVIFTGLAACFAVLGILLSVLHFSVMILVVRLVFLGIYAVILWYMFTPEVQQAFQSK